MTSGATSRPRRFGPSRSGVLEHLRRTGAAQPVAAIAADVGLHANTTRFHLDALVEAGQVHRKAEVRQKAGRPRVLYRAEPTTSQELYQDFAGAEVDPETVCRMHLGLLIGLLHDDDPWQVGALEPYVTPDLCIVRLAVKDTAS